MYTISKKISVIHKTNEGLGMARNSGLEVAKGQYVFFIDSDDYILPGLLEETKSLIEETKTDVVFYGFNRIDNKERVAFSVVPNPEKKVFEGTDDICNKLLPEFIAKNPHTGRQSHIRISAWNCCIKTSTLMKNDISFVSEREYISEDLYFYVEFFAKLKKVVFINKAYYCYCQNEDSLTTTYNPDRYEKIKKCYQEVEKIANKNSYDGEVQLRLKASFIATVIGCLKMEAGNGKKNGYKKAFLNVKEICNDEYLEKAIQVYPDSFYSKSWKIFVWCIKKKHYALLYIILMFYYRKRGI